MACLRRYLPPVIILLPLTLVCGKLLLTAVSIDSEKFTGSTGDEPGQLPGDVNSLAQTGWPWVFAETYEANYFPPRPEPEIHWLRFSPWQLLADVAVLLVALGGAGVLVFRWCWRPGGWRQFSLRGLLAFTALIGIFCGWWNSERIKWEREREIIERMYYLKYEQEYRGPEWLRRLWPSEDLEMFVRTTSIRVDGILSNQSAMRLSSVLHQMPHIERLQIGCGFGTSIYAVPDAERNLYPSDLLERDTSSPMLTDASPLRQIDVTIDALRIEESEPILTSWQSDLRRLHFRTCHLSDETMTRIAQCDGLEELSFVNCDGHTDAGVTKLTKLPRLERLTLSIEVGDETMNRLKQLSLKELKIDARAFDTE